MKHWQPGDQIATGALHFSDKASREAYGREVKRQLDRAMVEHLKNQQVARIVEQVMKARNIHQRRAIIAKAPDELRDMVKELVKKQWSTKSKP